ncbi:MAG: segregation/condensation protein A [Sphaerochaeta sp.]
METREQQNSVDLGLVYVTPGFEGPLELLLHLIQKAEVNIYDIPISEITEQFIAYLESETSVLLGDLTEFYKMAADLLYIKSRMLLPVELEFDEEYQDPRQELVERLLEHQRFKKYTDLLSGTATSSELFISRKPHQFRLPFGDDELFGEVTLDDLLGTFRRLMTQIAPSKVFNVYESVTVNEKIALMQEVFETQEYMTIEELIVDPTSLLHIICAFMAILDATKHGMIYLLQEKAYESIVIRRRDEHFEEDYSDAYDEDEEFIPPEIEPLPISSDEEAEFYEEDVLLSDEPRYEYDSDNVEEIIFDEEDDE